MLYFFVVIISISNYALQEQTPEVNKTFGHVLTDQYNILYIGTVDEFYEMRWETQILYIVETNFLIIICLNILISVVTDNYDIVIQRIVSIDCQYRAKLMSEMESLMFWRRDKGYERYVVHAYQADQQQDGAMDEMQGKFRMLKNKILETGLDLKK